VPGPAAPPIAALPPAGGATAAARVAAGATAAQVRAWARRDLDPAVLAEEEAEETFAEAAEAGELIPDLDADPGDGADAWENGQGAEWARLVDADDDLPDGLRGCFPAGLCPRDDGQGGGFAAGGVADRLPPGVVLAGLTGDVWQGGLDAVSDDELIGVLRAWHRLGSWVAAGELAAVGELARRRDAEVAAGADPHLGEHVGDEVAVSLTLSGRAADGLLDFACGLARLPLTAQALAAGVIDRGRAQVIADELGYLDDPALARLAEARVMGRAGGRTSAQLRADARRAVLAVDPAAAKRRRERARKQARVEVWDERSGGTAGLAGRDLPPADVLAADKRIDTLARHLRAAGAEGTMDQLRARVYVALLLGQPIDPTPPAPAAPGNHTPGTPDPSIGEPGTGSPSTAEAGTGEPGAGEPGGPSGGAGAGGGNTRPGTSPVGRTAGTGSGTSGGTGSEGGVRAGRDRKTNRDSGTGSGIGGGVGSVGGARADRDRKTSCDSGTGSDRDTGRVGHAEIDRASGTGSSQLTGSDGRTSSGQQICPGGQAGNDGDSQTGDSWNTGGGTEGSGKPCVVSGGAGGGNDRGRAGSGAGVGGWPGAAVGGVGAWVNLTMPLSAWLGASGEPGEVAGFGPIPAGDARVLAGLARAGPGTRWCVTFTGPDGRAVAHGCATIRHPTPRRAGRPTPQETDRGAPRETGEGAFAGTGRGAARETGGGASAGTGRGAVREAGRGVWPGAGQRAGAAGVTGSPGLTGDWELGVTIRPIAAGDCGHPRETAAYRPSPSLDHIVSIRQRTCGFPGCRRQARRCDADHTIPYGKGGRTCECNLAPLCRRHHRAKQAQGWHLDQPQPGVLIWRLPHGRTYRTDPEPYPGQTSTSQTSTG
jgi:hypothetical protein